MDDASVGWFDFDASRLESPVRPAKVVLIFKPGTLHEPDPPGVVAFVGEAGMPVFRSRQLHPLQITYIGPKQALGCPSGCLIIGSQVDVVAMAWTCSLSPEDRALLEAMKITPNFVPDPVVAETPEAKS